MRPIDQLAYLEALEQSQAGQGRESFDILLHQRLDFALDEYLGALKTALPPLIPS